MKWILLFVILAVFTPGIYCLAVMDYDIPIDNSLVIGYHPVMGQPKQMSLYRQTRSGGLSGILTGLLRYGQRGRVTYGYAEKARSCVPREQLLLHDTAGHAIVEEKGPDISVSMPKAWFLIFDGAEVCLYSRQSDWHAALAMRGVADAQLRAPSRLRSPWIWYGCGVMVALAALLIMLGCGALLTIRHVRGKRLRQFGRCVHCGYNLKGSTSGRCPECGESCAPEEQMIDE